MALFYQNIIFRKRLYTCITYFWIVGILSLWFYFKRWLTFGLVIKNIQLSRQSYILFILKSSRLFFQRERSILYKIYYTVNSVPFKSSVDSKISCSWFIQKKNSHVAGHTRAFFFLRTYIHELNYFSRSFCGCAWLLVINLSQIFDNPTISQI